MSKKPEPILLLSDARGVYIPRDFATTIKRECVANVSADAWPILEAGPDHESYWDAWTVIESNARITDRTTGVVYFIHHDGDCWLLPEGMIVDDDGGFDWPPEEPTT